MPTPLISREMELPAILSRYPSCRRVFDRYGLTGCGGELGPQEPLWFFARAHRIVEARLIAELEAVAASKDPNSSASFLGRQIDSSASSWQERRWRVPISIYGNSISLDATYLKITNGIDRNWRGVYIRN